LTGLALFKDFYVTEGRIDGLDQVELRDYAIRKRSSPSPFPRQAMKPGLATIPNMM
jgi:oligopeptidase B